MIDCLLQDDNASWVYEEAEALVEYYEQLEEDIGESIEFDTVAIRCEWNSSTLEDVRNDYNVDIDIDVIDYLYGNTQVIKLDDDNVLFIAF